ncbi:MAG: radical SAM protein [Nitrospirae bacterium]|nr:radical SAM protein [Nitrospirota bacterium]
MNVILVQPATSDRGFIHLGLGFIAASLEQRGHKVSILDLGIEGESSKKIRRIIQEAAPEVAGITALTPTYPTALRMAQLIREINPRCITVFGGTHPTILTEEVLNEPFVDIVVRGEGEITMCEILDALKDGKGLSSISGIVYKENGKTVYNPDRPFIEDLDTLPPIPWHLFKVEKYTGNLNGRRAVGLSAARGCPFSCVFCYRGPAAGKVVRYWSPERVVKEVKRVKEKYNITAFHFWNDVFTYDKKWAITLCDMIIKEKLDIEWDCQTRADLINEEVLRKMKEAGCTAIMLGVESGSNEILKHVNKKLTKEQIYDSFQLLHQVGFETTATFTMGLPWDTKETIQETIDFAKAINPSFAMFYVATPFPGSPIWEICLQKGIPLSRDWENYRIIPFEIDLDKFAPVFDTSRLSVEDLKRFIKTAQIEFQVGRFKKGQRLRGLKNIYEIFALIFRRSKSVTKLMQLIFRVLGDTLYLIRIKCRSAKVQKSNSAEEQKNKSAKEQ